MNYQKIKNFFFPDDRRLKMECKTEVWVHNGKIVRIRRSFYTFRSLMTHLWGVGIIQPTKELREALKLPGFWLRLAPTVLLLVAWLKQIEGIHNVVFMVGAIAYDTDTDAVDQSGSPMSFSHTTSGNDRTLTVAWSSYRGFSSMTYNSVAMTQGVTASLNQAKSAVYYLGNCASGAHNVSATPSSSGNDHFCAISWTGSNTSSPLGQTATQTASNSTTISQNITTQYNNSFLVDCIATEVDTTHTYAGDAGQTTRMWDWTAFWNGGGASTKQVVTAGASSMGWTKSAGNTPISLSLSIMEVRELAATGPAGVKTWNGLASASVKTANGLAIASVKTKNGLA